MRRLTIHDLLKLTTAVAIAAAVWSLLPGGDNSLRWWIAYVAEILACMATIFVPTGLAAVFLNRREPLRAFVYFFVAVIISSLCLTAWFEVVHDGYVHSTGGRPNWDEQFNLLWPQVLFANTFLTAFPLDAALLLKWASPEEPEVQADGHEA